MAVKISKKNNAIWPLPADYGDMTPEGQRLARVNAVSLEGSAEDIAAAFGFFDDYYLRPSDNFDPAFYDGVLRPSAPIHRQGIVWIEDNKRIILIAPRGHGKSMIFGRAYPMFKMLSRPGFSTLLICATDDMAEVAIDSVKIQLDENARLLEDFGQLRPGRGSRKWSGHHLKAMNGSQLIGAAVLGRKRGRRPTMALMDDPEFDPITQQATSDLTSRLNEMVHKIIVPMMREGCKIVLVGTLASKKTFLYHAGATNDDVRFKNWFRVVIPSRDENDVYCWKEEYPEERLAELEEEMGTANFRTEFQNDPRVEGTILFELMPTKHGYWLEGDTDNALIAPFQSTAKVKFNVALAGRRPGLPVSFEPRTDSWSRYVENMFRFITVDYAPTTKPESDFSVIHALGLDGGNNLWSLDLWVGKLPLGALVPKIWQYVERWQTRIVAPEAMAIQYDLFNRLVDSSSWFMQRWGWSPTVVPLKPPPNLSKEDKIAALEWRFIDGRIKLPWDRRSTQSYRQLFQQISDFVPEPGALAHDDAIDTLAMAPMLLKGNNRGGGAALPTNPNDKERLLAGEVMVEGTGAPLLASTHDMAMLTRQEFRQVLSEARQRIYDDLLGDGGAGGDWLALPDPDTAILGANP